MTIIFYHTGEGKGNENDCRFRKAAKKRLSDAGETKSLYAQGIEGS